MTIVIIVAVVAFLVLLGGTLQITRHRGRGTNRSLGTKTPVAPSSATAPPAASAPIASGTITTDTEAPPMPDDASDTVGGSTTVAVAPEPPNLRDRLFRTRELFSSSLGRIRGRAKFDETSFDELEEALILADVGLSTTKRLLDGLREKIRTDELAPEPEALFRELENEIVSLFGDEDRTLHMASRSPSVWLFVGVNGVGKTTTIGKVASQQSANGHSIVLAAGDTFRAAAGEQLETWAERSGAAIVRGADGADPSSVVFDAISHAAARGADLVLADSAGRLHNKVNLMEELKKIRRIADRPPGEVAEVLLVLDATTGQNGLVQAREFADAVALTGVVLTKLDGSAKGGIVLAIRSDLGLPIKLVGVGEQIGDLVAFDPSEFAAALLS